MDAPYGWRPDPSGRHDARFFVGEQPTPLVLDGSHTSVDHVVAVDIEVVQEADRPLGAQEHPAIAGHARHQKRVSRARRRRVASLVAVGLAAALAVAVLGLLEGGPAPANVSNGPVPGAGTTPSAFVSSSLSRTMQRGTADIVVSGSVGADGESIPLKGSGEIDFSSGAGLVTMTTKTDAGTSSVDILSVDGEYLMRVEVGGGASSVSGVGSKWVELPTVKARGDVDLGDPSLDPEAQLQILRQQGDSVTPLGTSTVDGVVTSGYSVTPSRGAIDEAIRREMSLPDLPAALKDELQEYEQLATHLEIDVWFDGSGLLERMSEQISIGLPSNGISISGAVVITFDHYGAPVDLTPPPPADVVSLTDLLS